MRRERGRWRWGACAITTGLMTATAWAQVPVPPSGPAPGPPLTRRQVCHKYLADTFIGRPNDFSEPPLGYYVRENFSLMRAKADPHKFTLYRTDFLDASDRLSPIGASRFNLMASRLGGWLGPVVIEWSPDQPGLSEARRNAVVAMLRNAGVPAVNERVVIAPSPYPGGLGPDGAGYYNNMYTRDIGAAAGYSLTPVSSSGFSGFGGGSQ